MGQVESHHGDRPCLVEYDVRRFGVNFDVEFGHGAPIAHMVTATHEHDFLDAFDDARLHAYGHGDVGQRSGRHEGDGSRLVVHDGVDDPVDRMPWFQRAGRFGQFDAVKTGLAVDGGGDFLLAYDGPIAAGMYRDISGMRLLQHGARIVGDLVEALVAANRGDADQIDVRIADSQQNGDGIVVAGIAVQNDFLCHEFLLIVIFQRCPNSNSSCFAAARSMPRGVLPANRSSTTACALLTISSALMP